MKTRKMRTYTNESDNQGDAYDDEDEDASYDWQGEDGNIEEKLSKEEAVSPCYSDSIEASEQSSGYLSPVNSGGEEDDEGEEGEKGEG